MTSYADFLGVMDISQAKTRFFKRDSTKADNLTLHPHKEREFWLWVASWALCVQRPSGRRAGARSWSSIRTPKVSLANPRP